MTLQEGAPLHPVVAFDFGLANLAASETDTAVPAIGAIVSTVLMPKSGYIVGYAINKSAAHTAGSLDFDITVSGTSRKTIAADTTGVFGTIPEPGAPFSAGDTIGVTYTSDANLDATTVDVNVTVYVMLRNFAF